jgi:RNA polymerase sigma factor (sigma-70 family)
MDQEENKFSLSDPSLLALESGDFDRMVDRKNVELTVAKMLEAPLLSNKEKEIISLRNGLDGNEPHTLEEVAKRLGVTRERVRQMEAKALDKLRDHVGLMDRDIERKITKKI